MPSKGESVAPAQAAEKQKRPAMSKSKKSGLVMPVARINKALKTRSGLRRIGGSAPVYMTAVVEFVAAELLELAGNETLADKKRKQITVEDVCLALRKDNELSNLLSAFRVVSADKIKAKRP